MSFLATTGAILVSKMVAPLLQKIGDYIFPYETSKAAKQAEHVAALNRATQKEIADIQAKLQRELTERNIQNRKEIAYFNALAARQTAMLTAKHHAQSSLRHSLIQDAIRNFPLNISPLVLLENNNININFLLGNDKNSEEISILDSLIGIKPLSVFVAPIHIDSRIEGKKLMAAQVWDSVYQSVESVFVNEYSRNSVRPVIFYPTAWNENVKGGLHAAEELYYFLKDLPSLVIEPRFDGKKLKLMFSCWGLGYTVRTHFRQEIVIDLDWLPIITTNTYERSKKAALILSSAETENNKYLMDKLTACNHNIKMYENLEIEYKMKQGTISELDSLGDYSKLFYLDSSDMQSISEIISASLGLTISAISDTHHLLASDIQPQLPQIFNTYFSKYIDKNMIKGFIDMYQHTYSKLALEFSKLEAEKQLDCCNALMPFKEYLGRNKAVSQNDLLQILQIKTGLRNQQDFDMVFNHFIQNCSQNDIDFVNTFYRVMRNLGMSDAYLVKLNQKLTNLLN